MIQKAKDLHIYNMSFCHKLYLKLMEHACFEFFKEILINNSQPLK
jgi:hypothetical protein